MKRWVLTAGLYTVGAILLGVGVAEYIKSRDHYYRQTLTTDPTERRKYHNDGNFSRTAAALCIIFGVTSLVYAFYRAIKWARAWGIRRLQEYEETITVETEQEGPAERNPLHEQAGNEAETSL